MTVMHGDTRSMRIAYLHAPREVNVPFLQVSPTAAETMVKRHLHAGAPDVKSRVRRCGSLDDENARHA